MTERFVVHSTFVVERVYDSSPARVFNAFADAKIKTQWFNGPEEWGPDEHAMDFRVGGTETSSGGPKDGPVHLYTATYHDIVPNERIVSTYEMALDGTRISVSLATVELRPEGKGTKLVYTEQGTHLDGHDTPEGREHGTRELFEALGRVLARQTADA
jgi:uncharacterized protein YndB with AHSA1/START domain